MTRRKWNFRDAFGEKKTSGPRFAPRGQASVLTLIGGKPGIHPKDRQPSAKYLRSNP